MLELLVVVLLIGITSAAVTARFGRSVLADFGSQGDASRVSLDLLQAQRRSITTGDNHYLLFTAAEGKGLSYQLMRRKAGGDVLVDVRSLSSDVLTAVSHTTMEFNFEGHALAAYSAKLSGVNRAWQLDVIPINGTVRVTETTP